MNWGKGITLALVAFAGMMVYFLIRAAGSPTPLVTDKYYEQELKYQQRINSTNRANELSAEVVMQITAKRIRLEFPKEIDPGTITGELTLLRPNDPTLDKSISLRQALMACSRLKEIYLRQADTTRCWNGRPTVTPTTRSNE
ncbi:MAG: FixH family protein [Flavobacteriales bacterium]|nr:FixH family protein [Flavobacteriales bacterium]